VGKAFRHGNTFSDEHRWRSLHFAVQSLSAEHRQVIELAYLPGLEPKRDLGDAGLAAWNRQDAFARRHAATPARMGSLNPISGRPAYHLLK